MEGVEFPDWMAWLERSGLPARQRRSFAITVRWYLGFCRRVRGRVDHQREHGGPRDLRSRSRQVRPAPSSGNQVRNSRTVAGLSAAPLGCPRRSGESGEWPPEWRPRGQSTGSPARGAARVGQRWRPRFLRLQLDDRRFRSPERREGPVRAGTSPKARSTWRSLRGLCLGGGGLVDEVRVWSRALSGREIQAIHRVGALQLATPR